MGDKSRGAGALGWDPDLAKRMDHAKSIQIPRKSVFEAGSMREALRARPEGPRNREVRN
ncbi:hypothetical protein [Leucobacter salsicius]|uniref:hypothetical protein n=1 Tax=Leucobacter salsicius TaxID=664638 RepID=UPI000345F32C|nr:hypothetical protein [Leucobacter salsicius]